MFDLLRGPVDASEFQNAIEEPGQDGSPAESQGLSAGSSSAQALAQALETEIAEIAELRGALQTVQESFCAEQQQQRAVLDVTRASTVK